MQERQKTTKDDARVEGEREGEPEPELTPEQRKNLDMHHTLALIHGFNEMAIKAITLGEKAYYRMSRDAAEKRFNALGGQINRTDEHAPALVIPGHVPEIRFDERDIELMRACVARYDAEKRPEPSGSRRACPGLLAQAQVFLEGLLFNDLHDAANTAQRFAVLLRAYRRGITDGRKEVGLA